MSIQLLISTLALLLGTTSPPNFYPTYTAAKTASKTSQKEMVVFFTSKTCATCESAWSAFTKDAAATQKYISTKMEADDFDGAVCFAFYDLKDVPAWVIVTPSSEVKEKWNGGWIDASGNPTLYDQSIPVTKVPEQKNYTTSAANTSLKTAPVNESSQTKVTTPKSSPVSPVTNNEASKAGYFLQAGYFGSEVNAQKMMSDLKTKGFANYKIEPVQKDGTTFYRVISKFYNSESEVNVEQQQMTHAGFKTSVKKS